MERHHTTKLTTFNTNVGNDAKRKHFEIGLFFASLPIWGLFVFLVVASLFITGLGVWIGHLRFHSISNDSNSPIDTAVGSILGLLAFMLGFTFSLTWSRFAGRNSLVLLQAKAIAVCYLRTSLLPEKQKTELRKLFREYVNILIELQVFANVEKSLKQIDELHVLIWNQTASLVHEDMDSELRTFFTGAVNELINILIERKTIALIYRIPDAIWVTLLFLAGMAMFAFGYQNGNTSVTSIFQILLLPVAFGIVIVLISELNSTMVQRRFKVTKAPLQDVLDMMQKEIV